MSNYNFNLERVELINSIRSPLIYNFNLARNLALLSNDPAVIRRFYSVEAPKYFKDVWITMEMSDKFLAQYRPGQAFSYFGICPMIVQGKVNLIASGGLKCKSDNAEIDERLNYFIKKSELEQKFATGVYWESGIGDTAFRVSYNPKISELPLIDVIEPHHLEVNYQRDCIKSFVIKEVSEENPTIELREIYYREDDGDVYLTYRFFKDGKYVNPEDKALMDECRLHFYGVNINSVKLPFMPIVFKKNANCNQLYKGKRGVPDIQGMDTIEDALTESLSDLIDAIRKGGVKAYINEDLIPQTVDGRELPFDPFNKTIITTKGSSNPEGDKNLFNVVNSDINWEAHIKTIQILMSTAINKAGISPTTIGLTGLESINSSAESQEAREKTSLRTRKLCLDSWETTLVELLNKYLQCLDYVDGKEILDYSELIKISFNEYISPSVENVTEVLSKQVSAGLKSQKHAIKDLNEAYDESDAESEYLDILSEKGGSALQGSELNSDLYMENNTPKNVNLKSSNFINAKLKE